jgi:hypothetical protein
MSEYDFTVIFTGDADHDALYEAGCDDATFSEIDGVQFADFTREAPALITAIASAIQNIQSVPGLRVTRVEPDELVTQSEIAIRLGRSRESVRLLAAGERGRDFPPPVSHARARNRLWRWSDVAAWDRQVSAVDHLEAVTLAGINAALELKAMRGQLDKESVRELDKLAKP